MRPATTNIMNSILLTLVALSLACGAVSKPAESQLLLDGVWEGQIEMLVMRKRIIIRFANEQGKLRATLDAPTSFTEGFPLRDLEVNAATIRFSMGPRPESDRWRHHRTRSSRMRRCRRHTPPRSADRHRSAGHAHR